MHNEVWGCAEILPTYLIWTQHLKCSFSLRVIFAPSSLAFIRHLWHTWSSFRPWLSRIELWVDSPGIPKKRTEYENPRFLKWPPCCDVTWLLKLITIPDCLEAADGMVKTTLKKNPRKRFVSERLEPLENRATTSAGKPVSILRDITKTFHPFWYLACTVLVLLSLSL